MATGYIQAFSSISLAEISASAQTVNRNYDSWWNWESQPSGGYSVFNPASIDSFPALARLFSDATAAASFDGTVAVESVTANSADQSSGTVYVASEGLPYSVSFTADFDADFVPSPLAPGVRWAPSAVVEQGPDSATFIAAQLPGGDMSMGPLLVAGAGGLVPPPAGFWTAFRSAMEVP